MGKGLPRSMKRGTPQREEVMKITVPFKNLALSVTSVSTAVGFGSAVIGGLPQGNILLLGAVGYLKLTTADADAATSWHGDFAVGTAPNADADLTDGTDIDILPSTTIDAVTSSKISAITRAASTQTQHAKIIDNTDGSLELNLNVLVDAADIVDDSTISFTADGYVTLLISVLGDD